MLNVYSWITQYYLWSIVNATTEPGELNLIANEGGVKLAPNMPINAAK
jgi:hypothetical protein